MSQSDRIRLKTGDKKQDSSMVVEFKVYLDVLLSFSNVIIDLYRGDTNALQLLSYYLKAGRFKHTFRHE